MATGSLKASTKELVEQGDRLFNKRQPLLARWQDDAENFYPERADFMVPFSLGMEFGANLMTGMPVMARRDLANSFSAMLRPRGRPWFHARTDVEEINQDRGALAWLDNVSDILLRVFNDNRSQFVRATKQGDNDFAAFGQCVIGVEPNADLNGILFRTWHLRDVVWCENAELVIDTIHRNWKIEARQLVKLFPKTVDQRVRTMVEKEPYREIKCRHIVMPAEEYETGADAKKSRMPYVSMYIDTEHETLLEETYIPELPYVIPRWVTISGSQYAYSPATIVAKPDARLIQQITLTLLEAGQKVVDPPAVVQGGVIQGDANLYAGGLTTLDSEYDERFGEGIRYLPIDGRGLNWGDEREKQIRDNIKEAFYLNQIALPDVGGEMTAYETQKRVEEYVRRALPLFEPLEAEYNGGLCDKAFSLAMRMGAFGSPFDMPEILRGRNVRFVFDSPLQAAAGRAKTQAFMESSTLLSAAMQLDPGVHFDFDTEKAYREAQTGIGGGSADWLVDQKIADQSRATAAQQAQVAQLAQQVAGGADLATRVGTGVQSLKEAGVV